MNKTIKYNGNNYFEIDCPFCYVTNFELKDNYQSGDLIECFNCNKFFSEIE